MTGVVSDFSVGGVLFKSMGQIKPNKYGISFMMIAGNSCSKKFKVLTFMRLYRNNKLKMGTVTGILLDDWDRIGSRLALGLKLRVFVADKLWTFVTKMIGR